jgi:ribosomal protein S18 acetylase RimI-like enzyme
VPIRVSRPSDDRALADLDWTAWPLALQVAPPSPPEDPFFSAHRQPEDVLVAEEDDEVHGYVRLGRHLRLPINDHVLHLDALAVEPGMRGRGFGTALVDAAVTEARRRGARKLGLRALSTNTGAIRLYERRGFRLEGRLREEFRLPDGSYADDLWYALDLVVRG